LGKKKKRIKEYGRANDWNGEGGKAFPVRKKQGKVGERPPERPRYTGVKAAQGPVQKRERRTAIKKKHRNPPNARRQERLNQRALPTKKVSHTKKNKQEGHGKKPVWGKPVKREHGGTHLAGSKTSKTLGGGNAQTEKDSRSHGGGEKGVYHTGKESPTKP